MTDLKRTPFYPLEAERGARFVPFAGYELPVQYEGGVMAEHHAVRLKYALKLMEDGPRIERKQAARDNARSGQAGTQSPQLMQRSAR